MKIVIDIQEAKLKALQIGEKQGVGIGTLERAVLYGIPLPKGHGRLIDADKLHHRLCKWLRPPRPDEAHMVDMADIAVSTLMEIEESPTIVEADKEGCL